MQEKQPYSTLVCKSEHSFRVFQRLGESYSGFPRRGGLESDRLKSWRYRASGDLTQTVSFTCSFDPIATRSIHDSS